MLTTPDALPEEPQSRIARVAVMVLILGGVTSMIAIALATSQYLNDSYAIHDLGVQVESVSLEEFTNTSATIRVHLSISNPHSTPIIMKGATLTVKLNGASVGQFNRYAPYGYSQITIENTVQKLVNLTVYPDHNQLAVLSQANRTGVWRWSAAGTVYFNIALGDFSVDVSWAAPTSSQIPISPSYQQNRL